ncbi:hypothetical protein EB077_09490, partial [bacterium]|nr:hypothetical protein [bacterium]
PNLVRRIPPKLAFISIGLVGLYLSSNRNAYLPFLGKSVYPRELIKPSYPVDANLKIIINTDKGATRVVYWAASPSLEIGEDPWTAYKNSKNVGVAEVVNNQATLNFLCPQKYKVYGRVLDKHIHYRFVYSDDMLSEVKTIKVAC